jgi:hypothetical protein
VVVVVVVQHVHAHLSLVVAHVTMLQWRRISSSRAAKMNMRQSKDCGRRWKVEGNLNTLTKIC